jgi:hypothetical protein
MAPVLHNVAPTVETIYANFFNCKLLPIFPNLTELRVGYLEHCFRLISPRQFPSLRIVGFGLEGNVQSAEDSRHVHDGVRLVQFRLLKILGGDDDSDDRDSCARAILEGLSGQFPNVLELRVGYCGFPSVPAVNMLNAKEWLEDGLPIDGAPGIASFASFKELETLDFDLEVVVTNDMITCLISKIPTLKILKFYWNAALSVEDVRGCLQHLKIVIHNGSSRVS